MKPFVFSIIIAVFSLSAYADKEPLSIAINLGPPWAYYDENGQATGIDVETIRAVFEQIGYSTQFSILPYNRLIKEFNDEKFDFASPAAFDAKIGFRTITYLPYHDVAITRKADDIVIDDYDDLKNKRIVAYQHALHVLGPDYQRAVSFSNYIELAEREVQLKLLAFERTDVVVGESRLLHYILKENYSGLAVKTHDIFPIQHYGGIGKDRKLVDQFDKGIQKFIKSGKFDELLKRWAQ